MEQKDGEPPPFWQQSTTTLWQVNHHRRRQRHASSLFLNTGVLVIVLLITAIVFLVIVIPSILSLARQVFNPSLVKSSWNSLNIVLVLFAIVCGFLGRKDDDQTPVNTPKRRSEVENKSEVQQSPRQWYDYQQDGMEYNSFGNVDTIRRLRSSSSYPDLRQESPWMAKENRWRFYDDTDVENYQFQRSESEISRSRSFKEEGEDENNAKNIEVDTYVSKTQDVLPISTSSPSPSVVDKEKSEPDSPPAAPEIIHGRFKEAADEDNEEPITKIIEVVSPINDQPKIVLSPSKQPTSVPITQPSYSYIPPPSPPAYILPPPSPTSYLWPPPSPPPPPPPPPPRRVKPSMPTKNKTNQTFETIGHGRYRWNDNSTKRESRSKVQLPPPSPPPPPPPPPPQSRQLQPVISHYSEDKHKHETSDRKRGGATKEFFSSFYHQSKRKRKQKRRSYENLEDFIEPPQPSIYRSKSTPEFPPPSPPPPPPPPLPPPHSVFHNLFSKKGKTKKKVHSVSTSAPPPPPPPPPRARPPAASTVQPTKAKTKVISSAQRKPVKNVSFSNMDDHAGSGSESPLVRTPPPPPPPPPFKMKGWHFVMQGDYVKIDSNNNSPRSGYSASEDESGSPSNEKNSPTTPPLFCPSPDVNTKADDFIAKFRAKLNLEKLDSINLKQGAGPSRLGQS